MPVAQRIRQGAPATLTVVLEDQNGSPADAAGAVNVAVAAADGTVVLASTPAAHGGNGSGQYSVALANTKTAQLNLLTATWTDVTSGSVWVTEHEICGGFFFTLAEARVFDPRLSAVAATNNQTPYSDQQIFDARREVEDECEDICDLAMVPRYRRETLDGSGTAELLLPSNRIRQVRTVRVYSTPSSYTSFTSTELAAVAVDADRRIERTDGGVFTEGRSNIVVEYEHGLDAPPADLKRPHLVRLVSLLAVPKTGVGRRATTFTAADGSGSYQLARPGVWETGIDDVDAAYGRHSRRARKGQGVVAASRSLNLDPQFASVFHGGRR